MSQVSAAAPSHWLAEIGPIEPRAPLDGDRDADVCIVGAGFTGLWTAYELRRAAPDLEVMVLDAHHAGFGASGRNGGWVLGEISGSQKRWLSRGGVSGAAAIGRAIEGAVSEIEAFIERERVDCGLRRGGALTLACSEPQMRRLRIEIDKDLGKRAQLLDAAAAFARVHAANVVGGVHLPRCARVQPAKLVRALAMSVERAGARLFESTPVSAIENGVAVTPSGRVRADVIVRATEGYTAQLRGLRRTLLPLNSAMIVTKPLDQEHWSQIGWAGQETVRDGAHRFVYLQRTADGRIAIGGRGVPYRFGSSTEREGAVPSQTVHELWARLLALFPCLDGVGIDAAWHGVLGVARDWMPAVGLDRGRKLAWAGGYAGEGLAASNLAGRTLCDLLLDRDSELTRLPWVGPFARRWPPEPLRFLGARCVYAMYRHADQRETSSGRPSRLATVADLIAGR